MYHVKTETGEEEEELLAYKKGDRYYLVLDRGREYPAFEHPFFIAPGDMMLPEEGECILWGTLPKYLISDCFFQSTGLPGKSENVDKPAGNRRHQTGFTLS